MNVSELRVSKFLKKEDCGESGILVTIKGVSEDNVSQEGAEPVYKWVMHFEECEKPLVLNSTCGQVIAMITGSDESEGWIGHKIVLYNDPSVQFKGKVTGGIRVRAPRRPPADVPAFPHKQPQVPKAPAKPTPASIPCDSEGAPLAVPGEEAPF